MTLLEPNYYGLWAGKQTAKGTPNTAPPVRYKQVAGDLGFSRDDGNENYSDLTKYGGNTDWVNSINGTGEPGIEATPVELAHLWWLFSGAETVTNVAAVSGPPAIPATTRHLFTPALSKGHWFTAFRRVGQSVVQRHQFNDCLVTRMTMESSTANKPLRVTPQILSLDPGRPYTTDPAAGLPASRPFLHTDLALNQGAGTDGSLQLDGTTFRGVSQWQFIVDDAWGPIYGDDIVPYDIVQGQPTVTVSCTIPMDAQALAEWNLIAYGTANPAAGTKPTANVGALGSFAATARMRDAQSASLGYQCDVTIPGVKWTIPPAPAPNADGGATEMALAGAMRPVSGQPAYSVGVQTPTTQAAFVA